MPKLEWDKAGARLYETGVDQGVLYTSKTTVVEEETVVDPYGTATAWNGLTAVSESPSGAEASPLYADNMKYLNLMSVEEFGCSIEAYTYPETFGACDGSKEVSTGVYLGQQNRDKFGLCYRTRIGNDLKGDSYGYKLHLVYGCLASPSEKSFATVSDSPEAITFSWEVTTEPVNVTGSKPTSVITIDSTKVDPTKLAALEEILYGRDASTSPAVTDLAGRLPLPDEIISIFTADDDDDEDGTP